MIKRLLRWLLGERRTRSTLADATGWMDDLGWTGGTNTAAGITIGPQTAMCLPAVYACVRVLGDTVASLPLQVYRRTADGGKELAPAHPVYRLLHDSPNVFQTAYIAREYLMQQVLLEGNAFALITRNGRGDVVSIDPMDSSYVDVVTDEGGFYYRVYSSDGSNFSARPDEVLHVPGLGTDGLVGMSVLSYVKETIGLGLAAEEYGARFFSNGARPGIVIEVPHELSEQARQRLRAAFDSDHAGSGRAHRTAVLEQGPTFKTYGITNEEAQFLETRKFTVTDVARAFRVPPHMIGDLERATFGNIEHQAIDFVVHSIRPWLVRFEQEYNRKLFKSAMYFAEHNIDGLLRGDMVSRMASYSTGLQNGIYNINEVRAFENLNPIDGGDTHFVPVNMQTLEDALAPPEEEEDEEDVPQITGFGREDDDTEEPTEEPAADTTT